MLLFFLLARSTVSVTNESGSTVTAMFLNLSGDEPQFGNLLPAPLETGTTAV